MQVLLLRWKSDDLGVVTEINDLRHVFEDMYHYHVQDYEIPDERPDSSLSRRVLDFLEKDDQDTLFIVYYTGHAQRSLQTNEAPTWFA